MPPPVIKYKVRNLVVRVGLTGGCSGVVIKYKVRNLVVRVGLPAGCGGVVINRKLETWWLGSRCQQDAVG